MFGFAERGRLAMYNSTLNSARAHTRNSPLYPPMAMMTGISLLGEAAAIAAKGPGSFQLKDSLSATVDAIPSALLPIIDTIMLRAIKPTNHGDDPVFYQMPTLLNGLLFVRVVEVSRPNLSSRAHAFRDDALALMEPIFTSGMTMMLALAARAEGTDGQAISPRTTPKETLAATLAEFGISADPKEDDDAFCVAATTGLTRLIMTKAGANPKSLADNDAFLGGLFAFTLADLLTQRFGGTFEIVSSVAASGVTSNLDDPEQYGAFVHELVQAFNSRASAKTIMAIGQNAAAWLDSPAGGGIDHLAQLFKTARSHVASTP